MLVAYFTLQRTAVFTSGWGVERQAWYRSVGQMATCNINICSMGTVKGIYILCATLDDVVVEVLRKLLFRKSFVFVFFPHCFVPLLLRAGSLSDE